VFIAPPFSLRSKSCGEFTTRRGGACFITSSFSLCLVTDNLKVEL
jgi:hypothetical protein